MILPELTNLTKISRKLKPEINADCFLTCRNYKCFKVTQAFITLFP